jgi:HD-GYP domain-containing protein (c-di-GMP phosphodiesterase class II)
MPLQTPEIGQSAGSQNTIENHVKSPLTLEEKYIKEKDFISELDLPNDIKQFGIDVLDRYKDYHDVTLEHSLDFGNGLNEWVKIMQKTPALAKTLEIVKDSFGLEDKDIPLLQFAGTLHDVGKLGVREYILKKRVNIHLKNMMK